MQFSYELLKRYNHSVKINDVVVVKTNLCKENLKMNNPFEMVDLSKDNIICEGTRENLAQCIVGDANDPA